MLFGPSPARPSLRSQYLLLDPRDRRRWTLGTPTLVPVAPDRAQLAVGDWLSLNLRPLASTPVGELYRNLDAVCPEG